LVRVGFGKSAIIKSPRCLNLFTFVKKIIGRCKDYDAFAHLGIFPNLAGSYRHNITEASIGITFKK